VLLDALVPADDGVKVGPVSRTSPSSRITRTATSEATDTRTAAAPVAMRRRRGADGTWRSSFGMVSLLVRAGWYEAGEAPTTGNDDLVDKRSTHQEGDVVWGWLASLEVARPRPWAAEGLGGRPEPHGRRWGGRRKSNHALWSPRSAMVRCSPARTRFGQRLRLKGVAELDLHGSRCGHGPCDDLGNTGWGLDAGLLRWN
jgi:hypothetical protein